MSSYKQILYHIVIRTKDGNRSIIPANKEELYRYVWQIVKFNKCFLYRINGVEDHIHLLTDLHPDINLGNFLKQIKASSSLWMKRSGFFPLFKGWSVGYGAFTIAYKDKDMVINYIKNQVEHHRTVSFLEEYKNLLIENGITIDDKFFP